MVDLNPLHWINKINESIGHSMADVLEFIGITNPAVDPDGIREVARHWKALGDALDDAHWHVGQALGDLRWEGRAADAFHARAVEVRDQCEKTAKACHDGHDQLNRFADQAHELISEIGKLCAEILEFELAALPLSLLTGPLAEVASNLAAGERAVKITALIARIAEAARTVDRAAEAVLESLGTLGRALKALTPIAKMAAGGAATTLGYDAIVNPDRLRHADTLEQDVEIGALLGIIGGGFGKGIQGMLKGLGPRMVPALSDAGLLGELGGEDVAISRLGALMREENLPPEPGSEPPLTPEPVPPENPPDLLAEYESRSDPDALEKYDRIRAMTDDVERIAENCGIAPEIVTRAKENLFLKKHDVQFGPGKTVRNVYFNAYDELASVWLKARNWNVRPNTIGMVRGLIAHEYVEGRLMEAGVPYSSDDPSRWVAQPVNSRGNVGAHELSPLSLNGWPVTLEGTLKHWKLLGIEPPSAPVTDDLSNLDVVVDSILKWWKSA
ncbi:MULTISPECIES: WXG100 family type VII secretion target [Streptomycetaceae]|uniref:Putative LysM domain protein n=1 Tax=Streptantibioticus cattleyicolor (strain ATCC 35852 / DSM 46488 / JCM 4925 / NBRC 14057 / NRRL 8057) TaxID=1003195 RepID=F8K129_STREN|nr:WXG100 family type VII secretion target [Streptantibioticus cattleyicolor]AEW94889.1 putative LysM domain protein [Streptantibioticus cattleyicolor NRRL 8057 = DSM 46488]MYS59502.1 peptidoglycan-binding protein LysM [Streptomyces sp. SID5468]CCB75240.1 protein of unknown function [Streptantibioticus cattleyicolor NRRL 8057 = DSM 46488]